MVSGSRRRELPSEKLSPQGRTFQWHSETQSTNRIYIPAVTFNLTSCLIPGSIPPTFQCATLKAGNGTGDEATWSPAQFQYLKTVACNRFIGKSVVGF